MDPFAQLSRPAQAEVPEKMSVGPTPPRGNPGQSVEVLMGIYMYIIYPLVNKHRY